MGKYIVSDEQLVSLANKIRSKTGTSSSLEFIADFLSEILRLTDTRSANATASDISVGKTAYVNGVKITGVIATKSSSDITTSGNVVTIPQGRYPSQAQVTVGTVKAAATYNVSLSDQEITSGQYLTGKQTIRKVITSGISAGNIKAGVTVKVGDVGDDDRIAGATGTFTSDANATAGDILSGKTAYVNGTKITGNVPSKSSSDLTVSGKTVTIPAGMYASKATKDIAAGSVTQATPTINSSGLITATATVTTGYVSSNAQSTLQLTTQAAKTVSPTESVQTAVSSGTYTTGAVKIGAISKTYVGSAITKQAAKTVIPTESEQTAVSAGVYTTGAVSVAAISKTYVGSAITREAAKTVNPTESEQTVVAAGRYTTGEIKVGAISSTYVGSAIPRQAGYTVTPSESVQTAVSAGKYTTGAVIVGAISSTYVGSSISRASGTTITPTESVQDAVSAWKYITGNIDVAAISSTYIGSGITKYPSRTYYPSNSDQTLHYGYYLNGNQTYEGVVVKARAIVSGSSPIFSWEEEFDVGTESSPETRAHLLVSKYPDHVAFAAWPGGAYDSKQKYDWRYF